MRTPLVQGSPYITAEFTGLTPRISHAEALEGTSIYVDGKEMTCDGSSPLEGSSFAFHVTGQIKNKWFLFAPQNSKWICQASPFSLTSYKALHGAVRLALGSDSSAYNALLKEHAGSYPIGSSVDIKVEGDIGTVSWVWNTSNLAG